MHLLVLGGTIFLGRAVVDEALRRNHRVTILHRGRHGADLFEGRVERLLANRDGGLAALDGRTFDAVVDTCGYLPRVVAQSARALAGSVGHYAFVSTMSVYSDDETEGQDEDAPLATMADPSTEEVTGETYGPLKALCEREVVAALKDHAQVVRPGLIVGPHDPTDRFTYWPVRFARGGDVLVPAPLDWGVEFTDVRDLAAWIVTGAENRTTGTFDVSGPREKRPAASEFFGECRRAVGPDARIVPVEGEWLLDHGVEPWMELPLWLGGAAPAHATRRCDRARAAGMTYRPIPDTLRDTLAWAATRPETHEWHAGLAPDREAELLAEWR